MAISERGDVRIHLVVLDDPAFGGEDGRERNGELASHRQRAAAFVVGLTSDLIRPFISHEHD